MEDGADVKNIYQNRMETRDLYCKVPMKEFIDDYELAHPTELTMRVRAFAGSIEGDWTDDYRTGVFIESKPVPITQIDRDISITDTDEIRIKWNLL